MIYLFTSAFAQTHDLLMASDTGSGKVKTFADWVSFLIEQILNPVIYILVAVAVVLFLYGLLKYFRGDRTQTPEARETMLWGLITLAVMVSVWGIINVIVSTLGLDNAPPRFPQF